MSEKRPQLGGRKGTHKYHQIKVGEAVKERCLRSAIYRHARNIGKKFKTSETSQEGVWLIERIQ